MDLSVTPMVRQYLALKEKHKDCLLFFRLGDFYELFYEDARLASSALDIVLTKRGKEEDAMSMCGIPFHSAENYIGRLIRQGFKVAICEQLETPEEAKKRGYKAIVQRDVVRIITPGTLLEENLLDSDQNNFLVSLHCQSGSLGVAAIDISTGEFFVEETHPGALESTLARLNPTEILVSEATVQLSSLYEVFQFYKTKITRQNNSRFDIQNSRERLCDFFKTTTLSSFGNFSDPEISAAGAVIDYIYLTQKEALPRLSPPKKLLSKDFLQIDASTRRSLELDATLGGDRRNSFFSTIDKTLTAGGKRRLFHALSFPLVSKTLINKRLDQVEWLLTHAFFQEPVTRALKECPDGERVLARLSSGRGSPRDLVAIKNLLERAEALFSLFKDHHSPFLFSFSALQAVLPLREKLENSLTSAPPFLAREGGFIRIGYSSELDELRFFRDQSQKMIAALQSKYVTETRISTLKIKYNNILGYYIEITSLHKDKIPPSFIHRQTLANNMRFSTPELLEIQEKLLGASEQALSLELNLFQELVQDILQHQETISQIIQNISDLDLIYSFATLATQYRYVRPLLSEDRHLCIKKGRHPTIEAILKEKNAPFVPNDCLMEDAQYLLLLTGPNMAGKSTYLRQNALIILLAQMGSYVPAEEAHIGIVDRLFSRVGAGDDLTKGRSTFMMEMIETASILNQATDKSFVILDEIGRGTSTYDGVSIAQATAEYLHNVNKCRTLFATHYHEMTELEESLPHLKCYTMSVKEWEGTVIFLHTIAPGKANQSYGVHVAALAGMPKAVIARAESILHSLESRNPLPPHKAALPESSSLPALLSVLNTIDPNSLSPKQALEILYQLKEKALNS
jgi:DNA mismatch repair protein MutS